MRVKLAFTDGEKRDMIERNRDTGDKLNEIL